MIYELSHGTNIKFEEVLKSYEEENDYRRFQGHA